ncbi:hypothetical protein MNJPNG_28900 [Cupriavidus oxalaticus]
MSEKRSLYTVCNAGNGFLGSPLLHPYDLDMSLS